MVRTGSTNSEHFGVPLKFSGFLKRALAQTCLRAWYQVRFFEAIVGHSRGLV